MSQNLGQLRTLTLSWLDDLNGTYFTPAQVNVWLNNAQRELQKRLIDKGENYYVERLTGTMVVGTDTYTLPTDFKKSHKLEVVVPGTSGVTEQRRILAPVTYVQIDAVGQTSGFPVAVCFKRNSMILRPIPDQAYTMYLHQSYQVADMVSDSDVPDCPADYAEYLAIRAVLDGLMKDQRQPNDFIMAKKEEYEKMLTIDSQRRDVSAPRMVVSTEDQSFGALY